MQNRVKSKLIILLFVAGCSNGKSDSSFSDLRDSVDQAGENFREEKANEHYIDQAEQFEMKFVSDGDSVAKFLSFLNQAVSANDLEAHKQIWKLRSVREIADYVRKTTSAWPERVDVVTVTDERPGENSLFYVIGLYEVHPGSHMNKVNTFRISKDNLIELYDVGEDSWKPYEDRDGERFEVFFEKFKLDSVFQLERVSFPFSSESLDTDSDKYIVSHVQKDNWTFADFNYDGSIATRGLDPYTQEAKVQRDKAVIEIRGVDNGIWIDYTFEKHDGKWLLISEKDSSN